MAKSFALGLVLTVRFFLELALLTGVGVVVWQLDEPWRWISVIVAPVTVAVMWGLLLSPKATITLPAGAKSTIETTLFLAVGTGLYLAGFPAAAVLLVVIWLSDRIALAALE